MSKFGLDYDETYTEDKILWDTFIINAIYRGHEVYLVTYRDKVLDWTPDMDYLKTLGVEIICTGGVAKEWFCLHFGPGKIDIWIDDKPKRIYENSSASPEFLAEWREKIDQHRHLPFPKDLYRGQPEEPQHSFDFTGNPSEAS